NITALPVPLSGSTCDVVNNMIYLSGGFNGSEAIATTYRYNPQNNTWEDPLPPLNTARFNHASHVLDDVIYVAGGTTQVAGVPESFFEVTSQVEFFDPASEADGWRLLTAMETPRSDFALHAWGGRLHAVSGVDNNDTLINDIESYDPAENRWLATTIAMPFGLGNSGFVSTLYDNILYSWGGSEQAQIRSENQFSAMQYSTTRGTWTTAQSTLDTRDAFASTLADDTLYVIAGATRSGEASDDVRTYRIQTHSWGKTSPLSVPRIAATAVTHHQETSNVIYVMGGFSGSAVLRDVEAYNPGEGNSAKWVAKSPLRIPRSRAASVIVDSKIYVFGGIGSRSVAGKEILANTTFEIYNTETDLWEVLGNMPNRRSSATTVSINDKIYLIGGLVNGETSNAVDIYTPSTNSWETNASTLISPRKQAASIVFNGRIYLFGGTDKNNLALKSIETYSDFTQTWKEEHSLLLPDVSNTLSAARHQQQIILVGSQETATTLSNNVYVLD
ncbi:MAG TPA: hypothetical protein ENK06_10755, partial [Gammaproteobacteria bacterium]|nr:hypothetical protein [Gammaproteobacteria bacterium]